MISFPGFSLLFPIFSVRIKDVFSPAHQVNQISCYICFVKVYIIFSCTHTRQSNTGGVKVASEATQVPLCNLKQCGMVTVQYRLIYLTLTVQWQKPIVVISFFLFVVILAPTKCPQITSSALTTNVHGETLEFGGFYDIKRLKFLVCDLVLVSKHNFLAY